MTVETATFISTLTAFSLRVTTPSLRGMTTSA